MLDVGSGPGVLADAVLRSVPGARVVVQDYSPPMLAQARSRLAWAGDRVRLQQSDLSSPGLVPRPRPALRRRRLVVRHPQPARARGDPGRLRGARHRARPRRLRPAARPRRVGGSPRRRGWSGSGGGATSTSPRASPRSWVGWRARGWSRSTASGRTGSKWRCAGSGRDPPRGSRRRRAPDLRATTDALAAAFAELGRGEAATTTRVRASAGTSMASAMAAVVPAAGIGGGKLYGSPIRRLQLRRRPLPTDGGVLCTLDGDMLTRIRTAAATGPRCPPSGAGRGAGGRPLRHGQPEPLAGPGVGAGAGAGRAAGLGPLGRTGAAAGGVGPGAGPACAGAERSG